MRKKLLFFTKMNFGVAANGGIKKKVFAQARAFRQLGFEVDVLYFENQTIKIEGDNANLSYTAAHQLDYLRFLFGGFAAQIDIRQYSYVYIRHFLTNPLFIRLLQKLRGQNPALKMFMEIPTYPYRFEFGKMPFVKRAELWIDERCVAYFKNYLNRIVTFSSKATIFGIPTVRTDNGIDIEQFGLLDKAPFDGQTLHLLGLANVQIWHGFDRFVEGLRAYYAHQPALRVVFHVVGSGADVPHLQALVQKYNLQDVVQFHGFLLGDALDAMFKKCHLGIGSCGMHRINVAKGETSALKSREYAARGLPFVIGYEDRGFPQNYPYLLTLPAAETPISIQELVDFYQSLTQTPDYNLQLHQYAKENLTWAAKLKNVAEEYLK